MPATLAGSGCVSFKAWLVSSSLAGASLRGVFGRRRLVGHCRLIDALAVLIAEPNRQRHGRHPVERVVPLREFRRHGLPGRADWAWRLGGRRSGAGGHVRVGTAAAKRGLIAIRHCQGRADLRRRRNRPRWRRGRYLLIEPAIDLAAIGHEAWVEHGDIVAGKRAGARDRQSNGSAGEQRRATTLQDGDRFSWEASFGRPMTTAEAPNGLHEFRRQDCRPMAERAVDCRDSGPEHHGRAEVLSLTLRTFESGHGRTRPLPVETAATGDRGGLVFGHSSHKLRPRRGGVTLRGSRAGFGQLAGALRGSG